MGYCSTREIITAVERYYRLPIGSLVGQKRHRHIVQPRQTAMYLCRKLSLCSFMHIGAILGGRDHTTVLHGVRRVEQLMRTEPKYAAEVDELRRKLKPEEIAAVGSNY